MAAAKSSSEATVLKGMIEMIMGIVWPRIVPDPAARIGMNVGCLRVAGLIAKALLRNIILCRSGTLPTFGLWRRARLSFGCRAGIATRSRRLCAANRSGTMRRNITSTHMTSRSAFLNRPCSALLLPPFPAKMKARKRSTG